MGFVQRRTPAGKNYIVPTRYDNFFLSHLTSNKQATNSQSLVIPHAKSRYGRHLLEEAGWVHARLCNRCDCATVEQEEATGMSTRSSAAQYSTRSTTKVRADTHVASGAATIRSAQCNVARVQNRRQCNASVAIEREIYWATTRITLEGCAGVERLLYHL